VGFFQRSTYMIGSFDGDKFTPETGFVKGLCGPNLYAAQTFADAPNGRRVLIAWLQSAVYPGMPFTQGMTVPTEMTLKHTPDGLRIFFNPVPEIEALRTNTVAGADLTVSAANDLLAKAPAELLDLNITVAGAATENFTLWARGNAISWNAGSGELSCRTTKTKLTPVNGAIDLRVLVDRCVLELFANDGVTGMTFGGNIDSDESPLHLEASTHVRVPLLRVSELESAWKK
jgi:fructan beta-fructosidase